MTMSGAVEPTSTTTREQRRRNAVWVVAVALLLLGLPLAVWADPRSLSRAVLLRQSEDLSRIIDDVRDFCVTDVVARVIAAHGDVHASNKYRDEPGGGPIPATFSLELGRMTGAKEGDVGYRVVSEFPFAGREPHEGRQTPAGVRRPEPSPR